MNTSTVYVEPIFVGSLVGLTLTLPFYPDLNSSEALAVLRGFHLNSAMVGVILVGAAYLIGIPADRLLDSILEPLERHGRILFVLNTVASKDGRYTRDAYPEGEYRVKIMMSEKPANDWLQYVRTRMRLMRAFAFVIPGLTFAVLAYLTLRAGQTAPEWFAWSLKAAVPFFWAIAALLAIVLPKYECCLSEKLYGLWQPPRTDKFDEIPKYAKCRRIPGKRFKYRILFLDVLLQPVSISALLLTVASAALACRMPGIGVPLVIAGALAACAVGFAWWRTSMTFMSYTRLLGMLTTATAGKAGG